MFFGPYITLPSKNPSKRSVILSLPTSEDASPAVRASPAPTSPRVKLLRPFQKLSAAWEISFPPSATWLQTYPCTLGWSTPGMPPLCCSLDVPTRMFFVQWQPGNKDEKPQPENLYLVPGFPCRLNVRSFHLGGLHSFICLFLYSLRPSLTSRRYKLQICRSQQVMWMSDSALTVGTTQGSLAAAETEQKSM